MVLDYTLKIVILGTGLLGAVSGALGSFAVLRKQSLLGDAISHASLPGVALVFLITMTKNPIWIVFGAFLAGWIGTLFVSVIIKNTVVKHDAALGIILSVFFGFGLVLLTYIQRLPTSSKSGLNNFLFGNASALLLEDIKVILILGALVLGVLMLFWKEFKLLSFDESYCHSLGFPVNRLDILLTTCIVISIVIGLQTVGVVLMSAMIIAPAAAARQWTDRLGVMVMLSAIFGMFSGIVGSLLSSSIPHLPTGPTIVLVVSSIVFFSLLFSPHRGLIFGWIQDAHRSNNIRAQAMLANLLLFSESETDPFYPHELSALTAIGRGPATRAMKELKEKGFVVNPEGDKWGLTKTGLVEAKKIKIEEIVNGN